MPEKELADKDLPIGIKLYLIVDDAIKYVQENLSKKYNLDKRSFLYLVFANYDEGLNQDKLSSYLGIDKSTVGRVIDKLENDGYLIRKQNPKNKRSNNIFITPKGVKLNKEILELIHEWRVEATKNLSSKTLKETHNFIDGVLKDKMEGLKDGKEKR